MWACPHCGFAACIDRVRCKEESRLEIDEVIIVVARGVRAGKDVTVQGYDEDPEEVAKLALAELAGRMLAKWVP